MHTTCASRLSHHALLSPPPASPSPLLPAPCPRALFVNRRVSAVLCGIVPSIGFTDEDRKNSVYYQQRMRTMKYEDH